MASSYDPDPAAHQHILTLQYQAALLQQVSDAIIATDLNLKITSWNKAASHIYGWTEAEALGQILDELLGTEWVSATQREAQESVLATGQWQGEIRQRTRDGKTLCVQSAVSLVYEGERLIGGVTVNRDVTAQKQAENALIESEQRLRLFIEHAPAAIAMLDKDMTYIAVSQRWLSDYRLEMTSVIGKSHYEVFPDIPDRWKAIHRRCLNGAVERSDADPFHRLDGNVDWVRWEIHPWRYTGGDIGGILLFSEVITERVAAQEALKEAHDLLEQRVVERTAELEKVKDRLEAIFNHSGDGVVLLDLVRGIQQANEAFQQMIMGDEALYFNQPLTVFCHPDDAERVQQTIRDVTESHRTQHIEARVMGTDGTATGVEISIAPVNRSQDEVTTLVCIIRDITGRKQAEQALKQALAQEKELGELKSRFVSMASHEFRTPLAVILASTETLLAYRERMEKTVVDSRLDRIRQQVVHMKDIMEDVLQLARMQAGRIDYKPDEGDLDELFRDIVEEFDSQEMYHGRIVYTCNNPPVITLFDRHLMRQVISNIIHNGLKYSREDQVVHVTLTHDPFHAIFTVRDEGIGIPSYDLNYLFEPFHRASNVGNISGTGLGLNITKQAVELHGGTINAQSQVDAGTTFTVHLPKQ